MIIKDPPGVSLTEWLPLPLRSMTLTVDFVESVPDFELRRGQQEERKQSQHIY
jgi:hypothetical protein